MDGLSAKQLEVLRFIGDYAAGHGYPPTLSEISSAMGWSSKARSAQMVSRLIQMGRLKKLPGQARTLTIVEPSQ